MQTKHDRTTKIFLLFLISTFAFTGLTGCEKKGPADRRTELVVLCGSSFVKPAEELCRRFTEATGIEIAMTSAGSEDFLPLVQAGKEGDILITHDPYLDYVRDANALADSVHVGFVAPVLAVQKGNPKGLKSIEDLTGPGLKVGLSNPEYSTCGEMVFALLEKKGIKEAVLKNVDTRLTKGHSTLGTWLETQVVDAVIMWNGVANTFGESVEVVRTPYEYAEEIRVHVIGLNYTEQGDALKKFVELTRGKGPTIFAEHGYTK